MTRRLLTVLLTLAAGSALAHPGHGIEAQTHWLTQPDHLVVVTLFALALVLILMRALRVGARRLWRKRRKADA